MSVPALWQILSTNNTLGEKHRLEWFVFQARDKKWYGYHSAI